jgi:hypothetical protein
MVGLGGLEPPTSRLSGGRSNQAELQALRNSVEFRLTEDHGSRQESALADKSLDTPVSKN